MKKESYHMGKSERFFPDFLFKEAVAALLFFIVLMLVVTFNHVPLESLADPTDNAYVPRPEWYFMFLFQLLKYFPGQLEPVAVVVLPTIGIVMLLLLPFYDTRKERRALRRPLASGAAVLGLVGIAYLTTMAIATTPPSTSSASAPKLTAAQTQGKKVFQDSSCAGCHQPGGAGPDLKGVSDRRDADSIRKYVKNPKDINPGSVMPPFASLTDEQLGQLVDYLSTVK